MTMLSWVSGKEEQLDRNSEILVRMSMVTDEFSRSANYMINIGINSEQKILT